MPVERIFALPDRFESLRAEAAADGFNHIETLWTEWQDGTNRFSRPGEMLAAATIDGDLAGIGGVTEDFVDRGGLRMRRFYVRPGFRRRGVARELAGFVLDEARPLDRPIALYTETTEGAAFWEAMGFVPVEREKATHILAR
jgi:GNAT superfamily N-acetyltransferase